VTGTEWAKPAELCLSLSVCHRMSRETRWYCAWVLPQVRQLCARSIGGPGKDGRGYGRLKHSLWAIALLGAHLSATEVVVRDPAWTSCESVADCTVGLNPCGEPVGVNREHVSEYRDWSRVTPWHCRAAMPSEILQIACIQFRCEVMGGDSEPACRRVEPEEVPAAADWQPYISRPVDRPRKSADDSGAAEAESQRGND